MSAHLRDELPIVKGEKGMPPRKVVIPADLLAEVAPVDLLEVAPAAPADPPLADLLAKLPELAKPAQVAAVLQTTVQALAQDRHMKRGFPYTKIAGRVRYIRQDILAALEANRIACGASA
jgi:hypothetical protein